MHDFIIYYIFPLPHLSQIFIGPLLITCRSSLFCILHYAFCVIFSAMPHDSIKGAVIQKESQLQVSKFEGYCCHEAWPKIKHNAKRKTNLIDILLQAGDFHVKGHDYKHGFTFFLGLQRPASKGSIRLQSANPFQYPLIDPQYLNEEVDVNNLLDGKYHLLLYSSSRYIPPSIIIDIYNTKLHLYLDMKSPNVNLCEFQYRF